jgi:hypothetical protein
VDKTQRSFYAGGKIVASENEDMLCAWNNDSISIVDALTGDVLVDIEAGEDEVSTQFVYTLVALNPLITNIAGFYKFLCIA